MKQEEILYDHLPEVFEPIFLPDGWDDDWILVPVENPDFNVEPLYGETAAPVMPRDPWLEADLSQQIHDDLASDDPDQLREILEQIFRIFSNIRHPGVPAPLPDPGSGHFLPPDCLAFYLPFHYHRPVWWGIYLVHEGIQWLTAKLGGLDGWGLPTHYYHSAARLFLYNHEYYHHRVESLASRLEVTHRSAAYKTGFEGFYQRTLGTDDWLEEALANSYAYQRVKAAFKDIPSARDRILAVLEEYIRGCPEGYRIAMDYVGSKEFREGEFQLAEESQRLSFHHLRAMDPGIWETASFLTRGFGQIKSHIHYVIPRRSPLGKRVPTRFAKRPKEIIAALRKLVGLTLVRHGGNHDVYQTNAGKKVTIPRHPGDLGRGLFAKIIKQAGLDMSVSEFLKIV